MKSLRRQNNKTFKFTKHENLEKSFVIPVDTSITSLMAQNAPNYAPIYTGDMPDFNKLSLMDLKDLENQTIESQKFYKNQLEQFAKDEEYKKTQLDKKFLNEDGTSKEVI